MIKEIYCKLTSDSNYEKKIESDDEIWNILQQVRVVMGTRKGQVLGAYEFGIDLEQYLFQYKTDDENILYNINQVLVSYVAYDTSKYNVYAEVSYGQDEEHKTDYAVVDIFVNQRPCLGILVTQT